jgi:hypothetical protein
MVEIGHVDILMDLSVLSLHLALPREGHLNAIAIQYVCSLGKEA